MGLTERVYLAPNNGAIGGGEIMLLRIGAALCDLGVDVSVVAPRPSTVIIAAREAGLPTIPLDAANRSEWMRALRRWDRTRHDGLLWCNGLVPSFATSGHPGRIVHLHQHPVGSHAVLAKIAMLGAAARIVPSQDMLRAAPHACVMPNWTEPLPPARRERGPRIRIGFIGRLGTDKGVHVLADAIRMLDARQPGTYRFVLAGEPLFTPAGDIARMEAALQPIAGITERRGWTTSAEFFDTVDLLIVPSTIEESFGLVAAEAMAARMPMIVSDAGALPEVAGPDADIVPTGDAAALADRIEAVVTGRTPDRTEALYERWAAEYSPEVGRGRVRRLVEELGILRVQV
ncbi:MAG: glycosyltransferase family 4 protein [Microbacterium sp.]